MEMKELAGTGMVEVYNNQFLWNNRQTQRVYDSFVDIWGTEKLWTTIDRANLNFLLDLVSSTRGSFTGTMILIQNLKMYKEF
jgi:hypothetical protein